MAFPSPEPHTPRHRRLVVLSLFVLAVGALALIGLFKDSEAEDGLLSPGFVAHTKGEDAFLTASCIGQEECRGHAELIDWVETSKRLPSGRKARKRVLLATTTYEIPAAGSGVLRLSLTAAARRLLRGAPAHDLRGLNLIGDDVALITVTLRAGPATFKVR